jgi:hypothetical protein
VRGQVEGLQRSPPADEVPPAERHDLTCPVASAERGKPVALPRRGRPVARPADGAAGRGGGSKRMLACNGPDRGCDITPRETGLTSLWRWRTGMGGQPAQGAMQTCRRGRKGRSWCGSRHRCHLGSRHCRSTVQVGPKANGATACLRRVRWPMLEPYEAKVSRTVLGGRGDSNAAPLPDQQTAGAVADSRVQAHSAPAAAERGRSAASRGRPPALCRGFGSHSASATPPSRHDVPTAGRPRRGAGPRPAPPGGAAPAARPGP